MKRVLFSLVAILFVCGAHPLWAQQNDIAVLRSEIAQQQVLIAQLVKRIEALEKQPPTEVAESLQDLEEDIAAQEDSITSLRETINDKVNLNGYYNFSFFADGSEEPLAFQQHHLGLVMAKQLGKFNFLMELELQNVPHHPEIPEEGGEESGEALAEEAHEEDLSGEGPVTVENAWMEYNQNRFLGVRIGKQLSPQYWWQNHYPNLTLSTAIPIYLRELFPAELVGVTVQGSAAKPVGTSELGVGYKFYVANNNFEGNSRTDRSDSKAWGARGQVRLPGKGALRRLDVAFDVYRGMVGVGDEGLAEDHVWGFESQLELSQFLFQSEWARGNSMGQTRTGYYLQPAYRIDEDWITFYRLEQLESPRIQRAEQRHLGGVNYRPYPQIAFKGELYRSLPLERDFIHPEAEEENKPFNGIALAAVFFF